MMLSTKVLAYIIIRALLTGRDVEGSNCSLLGISPRHLPEEIEEKL
jgi:hypothetical protein